ncbi:MAG: CoA transferase [Defluviicoccus sp.]|nr:CoA transferase [Defluviicoccus sp.]MDE0384553.1 CoA transferase [Defluviicoccus sp.]
MPGPLDGVRVLDLTTMVSGPVATMMLADQGADVIKIEPPAGDIMRQYGLVHRGMSASFLSCNRSKRSLCVDLKTEEGLAIVRRLAATADVLVQNFRPGAIERMGLGEDAVRALRPDIIFVSISGFGETGPYAHQRVYDPIIQALCGLCDIQADNETGRPQMVRTIVPDKTTSVTAAQAIAAALFARERTGKGQHVRLAMLDVMVAYLWPEASAPLTFLENEQDPARQLAAPDLIFGTTDGYITAGAVSDSEWAGMCRAFGREDLIDDPRFDTAAARVQNRAERRTIMNREIAKWPTAEILARLDRETVPAAPVLGRSEVIEDAQVIENRILEVRDNPELGPVRQPRPAARFAETPAEIRSMAPRLGADNAAILGELGYDQAEIARLGETGVLHRRKPETG